MDSSPLDDEPTDWPRVEWQTIDCALRCPICRDLFNTAMTLTGCGHTFCSICIRQSFSLQTNCVNKHCPSCRNEPISVERDLKNNRLVDDIIKQYRLVRDFTIRSLQSAVTTINCSSWRRDECVNGDQSRVQRNLGQAEDAFAQTDPLITGIGSLVEQERDQSLAICPVCNRYVPSDSVPFNKHLDQCLTGETLTTTNNRSTIKKLKTDENSKSTINNGPAAGDLLITSPASRSRRTRLSRTLDCSYADYSSSADNENDYDNDFTGMKRQIYPQPPSAIPARKPLKKPWFSGLSDSKLRQLLSARRIPTNGNRKERERRYMQYINLWNAACDGDAVTDRQLLDELSQWEQQQQQLQSINSASHSAHKRPKTVEEAQAESERHIMKYRDQFAALINSAKNSSGRSDDPAKSRALSRE